MRCPGRGTRRGAPVDNTPVRHRRPQPDTSGLGTRENTLVISRTADAAAIDRSSQGERFPPADPSRLAPLRQVRRAEDMDRARQLELEAAREAALAGFEEVPGNVKSAKRGFLFKSIDWEVRQRIQLDEEALYSVTNCRDAERMSRILVELAGGSGANLTVTDGTACVGGNVISFSRHFSSVNAVEIDETRFRMLEKNLKTLGVDNVRCVRGDYGSLWQDMEQDIVFVDPPWGGPDMMSQDKVTFPLGGRSLPSLAEALSESGRAGIVALKLSPNYDVDEIRAGVRGQVKVHRCFRKMILVTVDYRPERPAPASRDGPRARHGVKRTTSVESRIDAPLFAKRSRSAAAEGGSRRRR